MHTLIPNPDPKIRILLHHTADPVAAYVTVEEEESDAIGGHQWRLADDSSAENIRASAVLALITYASPAAIHSDAPAAVGTCEIKGQRYRISVRRSDVGEILMITERLGVDQAGGPRWERHDTNSNTSVRGQDRLTESAGTPRKAWVDVDILTEILAASVHRG